MSGGVDSSVAAALLVQAGYDVMGAFMVNYDNNGDVNCWRHEYRDAVRVAAHLGIPLVRWDFIKEYKKDVLDYMYREYQLGRTPNPDVLCNKYVKFDAWLQKARAEGFDYIATGHYARVIPSGMNESASEWSRGIPDSKRIVLLNSKDPKKDQTYFLNQLNQDQLSSVLFPIGNRTKPEVRRLAKKFELPTAQKEESMGICFVGEVPMKQFLEQKIKHKPGKIILSLTNEVIGKHDGLAFYTIGQRHMLNVTTINFPLYVVEKDVKKNNLIVGPKNDPGLLKKEIEITDVHWISGQAPEFPLQCEVRLRHQQPLQKVEIKKLENLKIILTFKKPQWGATPGQFAVIYKKDQCLGGGIIK